MLCRVFIRSGLFYIFVVVMWTLVRYFNFIIILLKANLVAYYLLYSWFSWIRQRNWFLWIFSLFLYVLRLGMLFWYVIICKTRSIVYSGILTIWKFYMELYDVCVFAKEIIPRDYVLVRGAIYRYKQWCNHFESQKGVHHWRLSIYHFMEINPWYDVEKLENFRKNNVLWMVQRKVSEIRSVKIINIRIIILFSINFDKLLCEIIKWLAID